MIRNTAIAALMFAGFCTTASAAAKQDFDLVNKTGYAIDEVYVAPSNSDDWEDDILGRDTLPTGQTVHIRFDRANKTCKWDLMVVYTDKETAEWEGFDLCTTSKIIIRYNRKTGETSADYE
jgi:hypothetical protein